MSWVQRFVRRRAAARPDAREMLTRANSLLRRRPENASPVTSRRLREIVTARGYHVRVEPDASLTGLWDGYPFRLRLAGEGQHNLSVLGTWGRTVPDELRGAVAQAVNDWNRDKIWPTVFTVTDPTGTTVRTEVHADVGAGATDRQLVELVEAGLTAGVQFFQALGGSMPAAEEP
ncbi:YbjN domain-containing protein [Georgenia alba]|uniref:YbjN domain-containing protein n=1 Tax=Georgenia alba TaxID=2233858 RepID=A0ABW2Q876_9MICO